MKKAIKIVKSFIVLIVVFYVIFGVANAPTIWKLVANAKNGTSVTNQNKIDQIKSLDQPSKNHWGTSSAAVSADTSSNKTTADSSASNQFQNDRLYLPRLNIEGIIEWNVAQANVNGQLINSLVHLSGTAEPSQNGDVLIAGHSSYYWWTKGAYKNIFAPLVNAKNGDDVIIKKDGIAYQYKIADISEIGNSADLKLNVGGDKKGSLYLITCVPVGTNLRRLVIRAELSKIF